MPVFQQLMPKNQTNSHTTQHKSRIFFSYTATFIYNLFIPNAMPDLYPLGRINPVAIKYQIHNPEKTSNPAHFRKAES